MSEICDYGLGTQDDILKYDALNFKWSYRFEWAVFVLVL